MLITVDEYLKCIIASFSEYRFGNNKGFLQIQKNINTYMFNFEAIIKSLV